MITLSFHVGFIPYHHKKSQKNTKNILVCFIFELNLQLDPFHIRFMSVQKTQLDERQRKTIASAIRLELELKGITHEEAAKRLKISLGAFRNKVSNAEFTAQAAVKWSEILGIPYDTFFYNNNVSSLEEKVKALEKELADVREEMRKIKSVMRSMYNLAALIEPDEPNGKGK